jgi:F420H(2)-dependent quinone reductase
MAGAPMNPARYHLVARPAAPVEANRETFAVRATEVGGKERDRRYRQHAEELPQFREYPSKTERVIPVTALERVA